MGAGQLSFRQVFRFQQRLPNLSVGKRVSLLQSNYVTRVTVVCSHYLGDEGPPGAQDVGGDVDGGKE